MKKYLTLALLSVFSLVSFSQKKDAHLYVNAGLLYNGEFVHDGVNGVGTLLDLEYKHKKTSLFSFAARGKYNYYSFDDGAKDRIDDDGSIIWGYKNPRMKLNTSALQIGVVPKFTLDLTDDMGVFVENDFSCAFLFGDITYLRGEPKKYNVNYFTPFVYSCSVGLYFEDSKSIMYQFTAGVTTLNLKKVGEKYKPASYTSSVPNMYVTFLVGLMVKFPTF